MQRPHIVLIFADQLHHQAWGRRDPAYATPILDRLAAEGLDCTDAWCTTPLCSPSRGSLFTGDWPHRTGVIRNGVHLRRPSIAPAIRSAGYHTAYCGKWHLGDDPAGIAGWDRAVGVCNEYAKPNRPLSDAETLAAACGAIAHRDPDKPLFLSVSFDEPHGIYAFSPGIYPANFCPHPGPDPAITLPGTADGSGVPALRISADRQGKDLHPPYDVNRTDGLRAYLAMYQDRVSAFDRSLEAVLASLSQHGILDDSIVIVTSDHGDQAARHGLIYKGHYAYDDVQRVPLIWWAGSRVAPIRRGTHHGVVSLVDVPATILDLAGADNPTQGLSLRGLLGGGTHARQETVIAYHDREPSDLWSRTLVDADWKYLRRSDGVEALIDRRADPDERHDAACGKPEQLKAMRARLEAWGQAHGDPWLDQQVPA